MRRLVSLALVIALGQVEVAQAAPGLLALGESDGLRARRAAEPLGSESEARPRAGFRRLWQGAIVWWYQPLLRDRRGHVRLQAAWMLERVGWEAKTAEEQAFFEVARQQWNRAVALGEMARQPLLRTLWDQDVMVQHQAAVALGQLGDPTTVQTLIRLLRHAHSWWVRQAAARALQEAGRREAIPALEAALQDVDRQVQQAAAEALDRLGWQATPQQRAFALIALRKWKEVVALGTEALPALRWLLQDRHPSWQETAAQTLGTIGDLQALPDLEAALTQTAPTYEKPSFDSHGAFLGVALIPNPVYEALVQAIHQIREAQRRAQPAPATQYRQFLNEPLLTQAQREGQIVLRREAFPDPRVWAFLQFLKQRGLEEVVLFGGPVRDLFLNQPSDDLDVTVKIPLTPHEFQAMRLTTSPGNERILKVATAIVDRLAKALGTTREGLITPAPGQGAQFQGLPVQYAGPIASTTSDGEPVILKMMFVDPQTKTLLLSNTGPGLLHLALDSEGVLYGRLESLQDLQTGRVRLDGDGRNFRLGDILRLLRLKHQFGLAVDAVDEELIRMVFDQYRQGAIELPIQVLPVVDRLVYKITRTAQDVRAAHGELAELGVFSLMSTVRRKQVVDLHFDGALRRLSARALEVAL